MSLFILMVRGFADLAVVLDGSAVACWVASIDLDFYNRRRPHSSLDGATPDEALLH
jgi:transposase InsO family protein